MSTGQQPQWVAGLDLRVTLVNEALTELLGLTAEQLVGSHVDDFASPEDPGRGIRQLLEPGSHGHLDHERLLLRSDGAAVPVRLVASLMRDEVGVPRAVSARCVDLSAHRAAEASSRGRQAPLERASDRAVVLASDGAVIHADTTVGVLGYRPEDVVGTNGFDFVHAEDRAEVEAALERVRTAPGVAVHHTYRLRHANGAFRYVESRFIDRTHDADIGGIVVTTRDVSAREEAARALRVSESRYRAIVETAQEGVWVLSPTGASLSLNETMAQMLGRTDEEVLALRVSDLLGEEQAATMARRFHERRPTGVDVFEPEYAHPDGGRRRLHVRTSPLLDDGGEYVGLLAMVSDVTEKRRMEDALRRHALYDDLTGLPSRNLLEDRLEQATGRRVRGGLTSVTAIVLDIDDFSLVNLELGLAAGDRVLQELAERLDAARRPGDTLARVLGDEFVVLSEDLGPSEVPGLVQQLQAQLSRPFRIGERELHLTACIGVAISPGSPIDELLRSAHSALEAARSRGRGLVEILDEGSTNEARDRMGAAADLRRAMADDELTLHFQPIVEVRTGRLLGLEAFARWQAGPRTAVPPAVLLAAAEQTGLAPQLDSWALHTATSALAELRAHGRVADDVYVSVNISAQHLTHGDVERAVDEALSASGIPADRLGLELAENAVLTDSSPGSEVLERIANRGVTIALDNFGTGYSSLAHLRKLPVARLKIDRMFVENLPHDVDDLAMVASVLELARAVRVDTVAVGVSTAEQADMMARLDCHGAQGALWSEPVDMSALVRQLAAQDGSGVASASQPPPDVAVRAPAAVRASREHGLHRLLALNQSGASLRTIAAALNSEGFRTPVGSRWHPASVASVIADHAYPSLWARAGE